MRCIAAVCVLLLLAQTGEARIGDEEERKLDETGSGEGSETGSDEGTESGSGEGSESGSDNMNGDQGSDNGLPPLGGSGSGSGEGTTATTTTTTSGNDSDSDEQRDGDGPPSCVTAASCVAPASDSPSWTWCGYTVATNLDYTACYTDCSAESKSELDEFAATCSAVVPTGPCSVCTVEETEPHAQNQLFEGCYAAGTVGYDFANELGRSDLKTETGIKAEQDCTVAGGEWRSVTCADFTSALSTLAGSAFYEHYGATCDDLSQWIGERCCGWVPEHCAHDQIVHQQCPSAPEFTVNDLAQQCIQLLADSQSCNNKLADGSCGRQDALCNSNECNLHRTCATEVLSQSGCWGSDYGIGAKKFLDSAEGTCPQDTRPAHCIAQSAEGAMWKSNAECGVPASANIEAFRMANDDFQYNDDSSYDSSGSSYGSDSSTGGSDSTSTDGTSSDDTAPSEGDLWLDEAANFGRLFIFNQGEWGTVCDDLFEDTDAEVACRQLGFDTFDSWNGWTQNADGTPNTPTQQWIADSPIWRDNVECTGSEERLFDCTEFEDSPGSVGNCGHTEDVHLTCRNYGSTDGGGSDSTNDSGNGSDNGGSSGSDDGSGNGADTGSSTG